MPAVYPIAGRARIFMRVMAYGSLLVMLAVLAYLFYSLATQGLGVIGSSLVDVEFPPPSIFPVYAKPITILYVAALAFMYSELELIRGKVAALPDSAVHFFRFCAFFSAAVSLFEVGYNFIFWSGVLAAQAVLGNLNPDAVANPFPDLTHPINVVFATKIATAVLIAGVYIFYYLSRIQDEKLRASAAGPKTS